MKKVRIILTHLLVCCLTYSSLPGQVLMNSNGNAMRTSLLFSPNLTANNTFLPSKMPREQLNAVVSSPISANPIRSNYLPSGESPANKGVAKGQTLNQQGRNYYVSEKNGNDNNDGFTPITAWKTLDPVQKTSFAPGDSILFERDGHFFGTLKITNQGNVSHPIVYSTYGSGAKPVFIGGIEQRQLSDWTQYRDASNNPVPNIWQNNNPVFSRDVANIIFNNDKEFGVKKMGTGGLSLLKQQGDFWYDFDKHTVLLYSMQNPAIYYPQNIRCVLGINAIEYNSGDIDYYTVFDSLDFRYYGRCVVEERGSHCDYRNLDISYIGGADQFGDRDQTRRYISRYGNGLQMWQGVHDVTIRGCRIDNVYDAGISPQSIPPENEDPSYEIHNLYIRNNVISNCEYNFEFFVHGKNPNVHDVYFEHNTCVHAGQGWAHNQRWGLWSGKSIPDPSGTHVRLERFDCPVSNIFIRNNIFYGATQRLFWMEFPDAVKQNASFIIDYNCYFKTGDEFLGTFCDIGCSPDNFISFATLPQWQAATTKDLHSIYADPLFACSFDYHLQDGSPAIGHAIDVGFGKDIGAYPFVSTHNNIKPGKLFFRTAFGADGKLVGVITECGLNKLYRYNTNGTPDASFGNGGVVVIDSVVVQNKIIPIPGFDNTNSLYDLAIDNKGRIIVAEIFQNNFSVGAYSKSYRLTRFDSNGNPDNSFGSNGSADEIYSHRVDDPTKPIFQFGQLAIQSDNKPVLTYGYWLRTNNTNHTILLRLNEDGTADLPFNTNPTVPGVLTGYLPAALVIQHNGRIVVQVRNTENNSVVLAGLTTDGSIDLSFGGHGTGISSGFGAGLVAILAEDAILVARNDFGTMIKTTPDGFFDPQFSIVNLPFPVSKVVAANSGQFYLGGTLNGDFALARYNDSQKDPTFGNDGIITSDFGGTEGIENMALVGKIMYAYGNGILTSYPTSPCVPPVLRNDLTIVLDASCTGNDGQVSLLPLSGTPPFLYSLNGGTSYVEGPSSGYSFQNLAAGIYQLRIKDADGCESDVVTREIRKIYGGPLFRNDGTIVLDASCGANDGNISIIPTCGAAPFMYSIDGGTNYVEGPATGYTFQNLAPGSYQLRLKDNYGNESAIVTRNVRPNMYGPCAFASTVRTPAGVGQEVQPASVQVYPNPGKGLFRLSTRHFVSTVAQMTVLDAQGNVVQQKQVNTHDGNSYGLDLRGKANGVYLVRFVGSKGEALSTRIIIQ